MENLIPLIEKVFKPKKGENFVIINDFPEDDLEIDNDYIARRHFARRWHHDLLSISKKIGFTVQEILTYEPTLASNKALPKKAIQQGKEIILDKYLRSLSNKDIILGINRYSATAPLKEYAKKYGFRGASMPGATEDMTAFEADYDLVSKKVNILAKKLTNAIGSEVTFSTGHKMYFDLREYSGLIDDGDLSKPGEIHNLPAGEAFIPPYEGFDKKLGESKTEGEIPVYVGDEKLIYIVKAGKIKEVTGLSIKAKEQNDYFSEDDARRYIAELGLGCNEKAEFCGKTLQDEKIEGMHFAYGYNAHFGGVIDKKKFKSNDNVIHKDIVYSIHSKIHIKSLYLIYKDDSKELILEEGEYVEGLFD